MLAGSGILTEVWAQGRRSLRESHECSSPETGCAVEKSSSRNSLGFNTITTDLFFHSSETDETVNNL
jgi:hypothetical protein